MVQSNFVALPMVPPPLHDPRDLDGLQPAFQDEDGTWRFFIYPEVKEILTHPLIFSPAYGDPQLDITAAVMWAAAPQRHLGLRRPTMPWFRPTEVESRYRGHIARRTGELLDAMSSSPHVEIRRMLAMPLVVDIMSSLLDIDSAERVIYSRWVDALAASPTAWEGPDLSEAQAYCLRLVEERQRQPKEGLLDHLIALQAQGYKVEPEALLTKYDLAGYVWGFLTAGTETAGTALATTLLVLVQTPGLIDVLRTNPDRIPVAIEEALRLDPAFPFMRYTVTEQTTVGDHALHPGDRVSVSLPAANRSPEVFRDAQGVPNPDVVDLWRPIGQQQHLTFGAGGYTCLGEWLARTMLTTAIEIVLERWSEFEWDSNRPFVRVLGIVNSVQELWFTVGWQR
jgi:cytochrome P450